MTYSDRSFLRGEKPTTYRSTVRPLGKRYVCEPNPTTDAPQSTGSVRVIPFMSLMSAWQSAFRFGSTTAAMNAFTLASVGFDFGSATAGSPRSEATRNTAVGRRAETPHPPVSVIGGAGCAVQ